MSAQNATVDGDALAIVRTLPKYPKLALWRGIEGWVLLEFTISPNGKAMDPVVIDSDPAGIFDDLLLMQSKNGNIDQKLRKVALFRGQGSTNDYFPDK